MRHTQQTMGQGSITVSDGENLHKGPEWRIAPSVMRVGASENSIRRVEKWGISGEKAGFRWFG